MLASPLADAHLDVQELSDGPSWPMRPDHACAVHYLTSRAADQVHELALWLVAEVAHVLGVLQRGVGVPLWGEGVLSHHHLATAAEMTDHGLARAPEQPAASCQEAEDAMLHLNVPVQHAEELHAVAACCCSSGHASAQDMLSVLHVASTAVAELLVVAEHTVVDVFEEDRLAQHRLGIAAVAMLAGLAARTYLAPCSPRTCRVTLSLQKIWLKLEAWQFKTSTFAKRQGKQRMLQS